ncbi:MAG: hypothetical protein JXA24_07630, partial [Proteobacteria bacterium]|nr:hypothetical protein [Pseudomonadota bacterium]
MSIRAPIFPSVMISAGTIPVPILFAPKTGVESPLLTVQPDTFTRAGEVLASGTAPGRAPAQRLRKSRRSAPAAEPPVRNGSRLVDLEKRFELARKSRASGDLESARAHYEAALESLDSPFDPAAGRSNPMRLEIEGGRDLFAEALFESCVLSLADRAPIVLRRLHRFLSDPEKNIDPTALERAKARTLQAYAIMQHTSSTFESRGDLLEKGLCMIDRVMNSLRGEPESRAKNDAVDAYARMKATKELKAVHQFTRATLQLKKALERLDSEKNPHERNGGLAGLMRRLKREHVPPAQGENSYTAQFLKGFTLIRLGMYASAPRLHLMQRAMALLDQAKKEIDPASAPHAADAHFSMQLLRAEILARKLVLAHGRREAPARKKLAKELGDLFAS